MTENPQLTNSQLSEAEAQEIMRSLLHKEGTWVEWGQACQKLQKSGYSSQNIFEVTGFQGSQQNLIIVASQVYDSLIKAKADKELLDYFLGPKSDILYEFRILTQEQRAKAAQLAKEKQIEVEVAREVARAMQEFSRLSQLPSGFSNHPGDAIGYQYWKRAKQKKNLQDRARLIGLGLKFVHSQEAREAIEKLLNDFSVATSRSAPLIPLYRLEAQEQLPRIVPYAGSFPLTKEHLAEIETHSVTEPFKIATVANSSSVVAVPGWQVILQARDPVAISYQSDRLPQNIPGKVEEVLVVVDRQAREWNINSYFLVEINGSLELKWFEEQPESDIIAQLVLILRPKRILDENNLLESWQMDD
jgi:hypothetical protein